MRKIKFRGLDISGTWVYFDLDITEQNFFIKSEIINIDKKTIGEFTGLTDKKGVEIYENDILKSELDWIFAVKWDTENARFIGYSPTNQIIYVGREPKATVIGNIFDNPELMQ